MKKVSVCKYIDGVESIYAEKPKYQEGHDGSDGLCDCIGMCRGGLKRAGATDITNMRGTNQAARKTIQKLAIIDYVKNLRVGDVVLKTRDKDDATMPLPDKYRKGGSDYDPVVGETNFTHIGTITCKDPLEITHMTSPTAKKDKSLKGWTYYGKLPWVDDGEPEPGPEPKPEPTTAMVYAENDFPVKMREKPSTSCNLYDPVPCGSIVEVLARDCSTDNAGNVWSQISYGMRTGWYMMSKFLLFKETFPADEAIPSGLVAVTIPNLTEEQANDLLAQYPGSFIVRG